MNTFSFKNSFPSHFYIQQLLTYPTAHYNQRLTATTSWDKQEGLLFLPRMSLMAKAWPHLTFHWTKRDEPAELRVDEEEKEAKKVQS